MRVRVHVLALVALAVPGCASLLDPNPPGAVPVVVVQAVDWAFHDADGKAVAGPGPDLVHGCPTDPTVRWPEAQVTLGASYLTDGENRSSRAAKAVILEGTGGFRSYGHARGVAYPEDVPVALTLPRGSGRPPVALAEVLIEPGEVVANGISLAPGERTRVAVAYRLGDLQVEETYEVWFAGIWAKPLRVVDSAGCL